MGKSILITGGARSGKSQFAEALTLSRSKRAVYIATAEAFDAEMADRIATHQARRGPEWDNVSAPIDLPLALRETDWDLPRLVDCITIWLSNLMMHEMDIVAETEALIASLNDQKAPVLMVTNEVGGGIVPENALARRFRDAAGKLNQTLAAECDQVFLVVSGCPIQVKPHDPYV